MHDIRDVLVTVLGGQQVILVPEVVLITLIHAAVPHSAVMHQRGIWGTGR